MSHHSVLTWIAIGVVAGGLASRVTRGDRFGCCFSLIVGLAGALIGGSLLTAERSPVADAAGQGGLFGVVADIAVAFVGAVILLAAVRLIFGSGPARPGGRR